MDPLPPILPVGTAVVLLADIRGHDGRPAHPRGSTAIIIKAPADPEHSYRIRFPGGDEYSARRQDIQVLRHYQREGLDVPPSAADQIQGPLAEHRLDQYIIYRCIVGSRAYGLDHGESDTDRRGIYLPPARLHWSIYGVPEQLENPDTEECYWELEKFLKLALKANPNVLEALCTPLVEHATPIARDLLSIRSAFLSKMIYQTFNGYAMSQFGKLEADLRNKGAIKWKHAMHLIRLLLSGTEALRTGVLPVRVETERDRLLSIRDGAMQWEDVDRWRLTLHKGFEEAFITTKLPERPDYEAANEFLIRARRQMAATEESP